MRASISLREKKVVDEHKCRTTSCVILLSYATGVKLLNGGAKKTRNEKRSMGIFDCGSLTLYSI